MKSWIDLWKSRSEVIPRRESVEGLYRLSGLQQGMLFHALYDSRAGAYTEQLSCDLINPDLKLSERAGIMY